MDKTQILSIELTTECNLGAEHARCPNCSLDRYRFVNTMMRLTDNGIAGLVHAMYGEHGFRGVVAWHYYCEPLMETERMLALMSRIKAETPKARFLLWTNGILLPEDLSPLKAFERIVITDYGRLNAVRLAALCQQQPGVTVHQWQLDGRLNIQGKPTPTPCGRMFSEFIVDAFGNVHVCCFDWRGQAVIGNVHHAPLASLVARWQQIRDAVCGREMLADSPEVCRRCTTKHPGIDAILPPLVCSQEAFDASQRYVADMRKPLKPTPDVANRKIAVVFVSYLKVPLSRLREHFRWNHAIYERSKATVYVVTEAYKVFLPLYAKSVIYPQNLLPVVDGERRFSICATKNAGVDAALKDGADVIICMDVDHALSPDCLDAMVGVRDNEAVVPTYRMVVRHGDAEYVDVDHGATGVVAMVANNWRRVRWNERCVAYGGDDGIILKDIERAGLRIKREPIIEHVEHPGTTPEKNQPGHGRAGCYGRDGFNFDNFENNRKLHATR